MTIVYFNCALAQTYSFNLQLSSVLQERAGIFLSTPTKNVSANRLKFMELFLKRLKKQRKIGRDLKRSVERDMFFYRTNGCYKGTRMAQNLPCHGQRTKTNAQTKKKTRKFFLALSESIKKKQEQKAKKKVANQKTTNKKASKKVNKKKPSKKT